MYTDLWSNATRLCCMLFYVNLRRIHCNLRRNIAPCWRHQMETFSALLAICAGNPPVPGDFPAQRPVTRSFDVFFDLHPNKRLSKQWWGWWFETPSSPLWRHCNGAVQVEVKWRSNVSAGRILFDTCDTVTLDELVFTSDHMSIVTTEITDNSIVYSSACTSKQQDLT